jgi:taurine dioxygenase
MSTPARSGTSQRKIKCLDRRAKHVNATEIRIKPLAAPFGAEVLGLNAGEALTDRVAQELIEAWGRHSILLIRAQELEPEAQVRFAGTFGDVIRDQYGIDGWTYISNVEGGYLPKGELVFHSDHAMAPTMPQGTILYGIDVPPPGVGGETLFVDGRLAYQSLPEKLRSRIRGLKVRHSRRHSDVDKLTEKGIEHSEKKPDDLREFDRPLALRHPKTHESLLFICPRFSPSIPGLPPAESDALVKELLSYIDRPEIIYRHAWLPGDVLLWDNITLQHARTDWDPKYRRHLRRVIFGAMPANEAVAPT